MFKLWRREANKNTAPDLGSKRKQAQFMQNLSQVIKIVRKKQQFYTRILFVQISPFSQTTYAPQSQPYARVNFNLGIRQHTSYSGFGGNSETINIPQTSNAVNVDVFRLQSQIENFITEEQQIVSGIKQFQEEPFFISKKFLYSMFVRLLQIFQFAKQGVLLKCKNQEKVYCRNWEKFYEDNKIALADCYQNLVYFQNFNVLELATLALKKQNHRIFSIVPSRVKKNQIALKPIVRLNSTQMRKTHSVQMKPKKDEISELISKKLTVKQKKILFTEKRLEERKKAKQKPFNMKTLYGILNVKIPKIQEGLAYRRQMQMDALQRNQLIQQQRKKWEKKCEQRTGSLKIITH